MFPGTYHLDWQNSYPEEEDLRQIPIFKDYKLNQINYKCEDDLLDLTAIQLIFTNGFSTPLYEVEGASTEQPDTMKSIRVDPERTIRWVSIKADGPWTKGLRLIDELNETIVEETWYVGEDGRSGDWTTP